MQRFFWHLDCDEFSKVATYLVHHSAIYYNKVYAHNLTINKPIQMLKTYFFLLFLHYFFLFVCFFKVFLYLCNRKQEKRNLNPIKD